MAPSLATADVDHDGQMDVVVGDTHGRVWILHNVGTSGIANFTLEPLEFTRTATGPISGAATLAPPSTATIIAPGVIYGLAGSVTVMVSAAVGTPGGTVQLVVDGGAPLSGTLSGGSFTFTTGVLPAGTHTLTADYLGSITAQPSTQSGTLTVTRALLTIRADDARRLFNQPNQAFTPWTATFTGLVNGD